jgi:integrase
LQRDQAPSRTGARGHQGPGTQAIDLERYYAVKAEAGLAPATLAKHHHVLHGVLEAAVRAQLVVRNVSKLVTGKPHQPEGHADAIEHCWTADEAATFIRAAKAAGARPAAFYALALDSGMRKSELCGLLWRDVDLMEGRVRVSQQLLKGGPNPTFSPVKGQEGAHGRHRHRDGRSAQDA